ncbi:hypothetical protein LXA43DRAFT_510911 [Ganoderma leucocontextum]|nr:hypothetical protein LXA43DRAFT_510911 [Ganoderma leucocontextum]
MLRTNMTCDHNVHGASRGHAERRPGIRKAAGHRTASGVSTILCDIVFVTLLPAMAAVGLYLLPESVYPHHYIIVYWICYSPGPAIYVGWQGSRTRPGSPV